LPALVYSGLALSFRPIDQKMHSRQSRPIGAIF
jgi:hypothetical protein